ncbi:hypothetical protein [Nocardia sp. NPDC056000]|uniref:hypothetical protein n=1 Tax=Nocardia sp. NPDC056000 TaxID=3345674 RepID=UPI0035DB7F3E
MTFTQQLLVTLVQTSSTALLVAGFGSIAAASWSRRHDRRRESFEVRTKLLHDAARIGQGMYVFLQHTRRQLIQATGAAQRSEILAALDERFLAFSTEAAELQTVLGARFGVVRAAPVRAAEGLAPFLRWHQAHDLLALYYYNRKEFFPGIVLTETSFGHDGNYHSGLDVGQYRNVSSLNPEALRRMRREIRGAYDLAMSDLVRGITCERINLG